MRPPLTEVAKPSDEHPFDDVVRIAKELTPHRLATLLPNIEPSLDAVPALTSDLPDSVQERPLAPILPRPLLVTNPLVSQMKERNEADDFIITYKLVVHGSVVLGADGLVPRD
jgi:hypothetical protein